MTFKYVMRRFSSERAFGRVIQLFGLALMVVSATAFFATRNVRAETIETVLRQSAQAMHAALDVAAAPSPSPSPTPESAAMEDIGEHSGLIATPGPSTPPVISHGGRLEYTINGSLSLGNRSSGSTRLDGTGETLVSNVAETDGSVGMNLELRRRTAMTTTDLQIPLGISTQGAQYGYGNLSYSTPKYTLGYASIPIALLGQLTLGATQRGPYMTVPYGTGDISMFEGFTTGVDQEGLHLYGMRARRLYGRTLMELGYVYNPQAPQTGSAGTAFVGVAYAKNALSAILETAEQHRETPTGDLSLFSSQLRLDDGLQQGTYSLTLRDIPERLLSYNAGELSGDKLADFSYRSNGRGALGLDFALEKSSYLGQVSSQERSLLNYDFTTGAIGYSVGLQNQRIAGSPTEWSGLGSLQLSFPIRNGYGVASAQFGRTTEDGTGPVGTALYNVALSRQFGSYVVGGSLTRQNQSSTTTGFSRQSTAAVSFQRTFGKTSIGYQYQLSRTQSPVSDALQSFPAFIVQRQISPVISVQAQYSIQHLSDPINPGSNGTSRNFSIQLNAPFAVGNTNVEGRTDPRLPAMIEGRITADLGNNNALAGLLTGGLGNIVVVLDNTQIQRTDLQGNFQFSYVRPGSHQLRVETASLPRGYTVDQPIVTLNLDGGQTAQVYLRVGDFGGIVGHVFGTDANGQRIPLAGVKLRIDGGQYAQTDQQGIYGFGRLLSGSHTIEIIENTVPAFASFDEKSVKRDVSVQRGSTATLDFVGEQLGSITGKVVYDATLAPNYTGPVMNAYVVAEPGEHAAITNDDGTFLIDDLPPGDYTVSVDPETVPEETGQLGDPLSVVLKGNDNYRGALFLVGHAVKKVVFSLLSGGAVPASLHVSEGRLPPGGATDVSVTAPADAHTVTVSGLGDDVDLSFDAKRKEWTGTVLVPSKAAAGTVTLTASVRQTSGSIATATAKVVIDPKLPIAIVQLIPANAAIGSFAAARARFLVDARPGDKIDWEDGQETVLGKPVVGRIFTFSLRLSLRPLHGVLLTKTARLPISIM